MTIAEAKQYALDSLPADIDGLNRLLEEKCPGMFVREYTLLSPAANEGFEQIRFKIGYKAAVLGLDPLPSTIEFGRKLQAGLESLDLQITAHRYDSDASTFLD